MNFRAVSCLTGCVILVAASMAFAGAPYTRITYPVDGSTFASGAHIRVSADAKDTAGIESVRLWLNDSYHSLDNIPPYEFNVSGLSEGVHTIMVKSENRHGDTLDSNIVSIVVNKMTTYTTIISPVNGATFMAGDDIKVTANAYDPDGILSIRLWINSVARSIDTAAPFKFTIRNLAPGTHSLVVRSKDNKENFLDSPPVIITVTESGGENDEDDAFNGSVEEQTPWTPF